MASSPEAPSKVISQLRRRLSRTTSTIAHLNRLLSETSTLDTALLTTTYTLHLLHSLLTKSPRLSTTRLATTLAPLTALVDEFRVFLRLWGLLGIYSWGAATYSMPPRDVVIRGITWAQVGACAVFQALENGAYLAGRGIIGWDKKTVARAWVWSSRAWMAHVALEITRLGYEWRQLKGEEYGRKNKGVRNEQKAADEGEVVEEKGELELRVEMVEEERVRERWGRWLRELGVNTAYAPMTVHYSLEEGPLGEGSLGALGVVVGWLSIGRAWKASA